MSLSRYFIAIIPPEPAFGHAESIKKELHEKFGLKAALRSPAHITLHMPFEWKEEKEKQLIVALEKIKDIPKGEIRLHDIGEFNKSVIFVKVNYGEELVMLRNAIVTSMKTQLNIFNESENKRPFHPHLTLAFRDLKPAHFQAVWNFINEHPVDFCFNIQEFSLLKHNGTKWLPFQDFKI